MWRCGLKLLCETQLGGLVKLSLGQARAVVPAAMFPGTAG